MSVFTYENDRFYLDGQPYRILSGAMHYFRVLPEYWEDRMRKLKECGFNTLETYTCWNLHERREGVFDFSGRLDLVRYLQTAQRLGLHVILRPGPYICAEWEFGGMPSWLLRDPGLGLRCMDEAFLEKVRRYYTRLFGLVRPYLCTNGGNILMVQVENEYGSYGNDKDYLRAVEAITRECGVDCLLFTSDGTDDWMLGGGTLPHLLATANFGSRPRENFENLRRFRQNEPLMCTEFWSGWFDHWGEQHHTRTAEDVAGDLEGLLQSGASFNFYMFHGGTNFGFTNGANHTGTQYQPTVTSYDYCAPLSECGDLTPTYHAIRRMLGVTAPLTVGDLPKAAYGSVRLTQCARLLDRPDALAPAIPSAAVKTMEQLGQDFGYILYSTTLRGPFTALPLELGRVRDRALVYLNGRHIATFMRSEKTEAPVLSLGCGETARLDILVENMGRVNYGTRLFDCKGLPDGVRLGQQFHFGWDIRCLTMEDLSGLEWSGDTACRGTPAFLRGSFRVAQRADTFLVLPGFHKGFVTVNGFNLGRYWNDRGPQRSLYLPAPLLREGENEITVFESDRWEDCTLLLTDRPDLG